MLLLHSNIMDILVHEASSNVRQWRYIRRLIAKGYPRPTEEDLEDIQYLTHVSYAKYFKSLGIPLVLCCAEIAKVYPEVLDLLKDYPDNADGYGDAVEDKMVYMSEELLVVAATLRPDLRKKLREIVVREGYRNLFQRFGFNITLDEVDIKNTFRGYGIEHLQKYAEMFKVPISTFYPAVISSYIPSIFEDFICPEFANYCMSHWDETHPAIKKFLRKEYQFNLPSDA